MERALFPAQIFAFLQDTQAKALGGDEKLHGAGLETLLINTLVKELDAKGHAPRAAQVSSFTARHFGSPISSLRRR